jgi:hypothetical protein
MNMNMKHMLMTGLTAYVGSLGLLGLPKDADAYQLRRPATECESRYDEDDVSKTGGYFRNNSGSTQYAYCPIDGTSDMQVSEINHVAIHGSFAGGDARVCTRAWNSTSIWCGLTADYSSEMYGVEVTDLSGLSSYANFAYVDVLLPSGKSINGYFITD